MVLAARVREAPLVAQAERLAAPVQVERVAMPVREALAAFRS